MAGTIYSVLLWGSHPDAGNDDCWMSYETMDLAEALAVYHDPAKCEDLTGPYFARTWGDSAYIELAVMEAPNSNAEVSNPSVYKVRPNPDHKPSTDSLEDWRRECAMEAGMLGGVEAYNEVMGC